MTRPIHDLLTKLMWEAYDSGDKRVRHGGLLVEVTELVFWGLVAEGMQAWPPNAIPRWTGSIELPVLRRIKVWQDDTDGFDIFVSAFGSKIRYNLTAHQKMDLAATQTARATP